MQLLIVGVDFVTGITFFCLLGLIVFFIIKQVIKKRLKNSVGVRVNRKAFILTLIITPLTLVFVALIIFFYYSHSAKQSRIEAENVHYKLMDEEITKMSLIGKTKNEIMEEFGESDTTNSTMIYDLSNGSHKYILEFEFQKNQVIRFNKKTE